MPEGAIYVGRPSKWGNPFTTEDAIDAGYSAERAAMAAKFAFQQWLLGHPMWSPPGKAFSPKIRDRILAGIGDLRGKDLACWCRLDQECHAEILLEIANR